MNAKTKNANAKTTPVKNANAKTKNANAPVILAEHSDTLYDKYTDTLTALSDGTFLLNGKQLPLDIVIKNSLFGLRVRKRNIKTNNRGVSAERLEKLFDEHLTANYAGFETVSEYEKSLKPATADAPKNNLNSFIYVEIRNELADKFEPFKSLAVDELLELVEKNKPELYEKCLGRAKTARAEHEAELEKKREIERERQIKLLDSL